MIKQQFINILKSSLMREMYRPGYILYSPIETLTRNDVLVIGYNPGGESGRTIRDEIENENFPKKHSYIYEKWMKKNKKGEYGAGEHPFQKNIKAIFDSNNLNIEQTICTNLIYFQSPNAKGVSYKKDADTCWPVNEFIINKVSPKLIITIGNSYSGSAFSYIHKKFNTSEIRTFDSQHKPYLIKTSTISINGNKIMLLGLPHLSRYSPLNKPEAMSVISNYITKSITKSG